MTTSTHTADSLDTVEAIVSRAVAAGQLPPSMRAWALLLGNKDRAALEQWLRAQGVETGEAGADLEALRTVAAAAGWRVRPLYGREGRLSAFEVETQAASPGTTRREAEALRRLRALLLAGSPFDAAVWDATGHGRDLDTARLVELYRQHRPAGDDAQGGAA